MKNYRYRKNFYINFNYIKNSSKQFEFSRKVKRISLLNNMCEKIAIGQNCEKKNVKVSFIQFSYLNL